MVKASLFFPQAGFVCLVWNVSALLGFVSLRHLQPAERKQKTSKFYVRFLQLLGSPVV